MANSKAIGVAYSDPAISGGTVDNTPVGATTPSTGAFTTLTSSGTSTLGDAASDLVGFHGSAGTAQATFVATQSINALSVSGVVGFTSSTSLSAVVTMLNAIQQVLINHGLMAAS
jgi:hypothetical protein